MFTIQQKEIFSMARIEIDVNRCKGCGLCTIACPRSLITLSTTINSLGYTPAVILEQDKCTGCTLCAEMCPDVAIVVFR
jgi:2-oxoglutarate ferredoxin oxidoreductase subunit delta